MRSGINPWTEILRIFCTSCLRWKLRSRKFACERRRPNRCSKRHRTPGEKTVGLGPSENAAAVRQSLQKHDRAGTTDEYTDGTGGRLPAIDYRDDYGLHQRLGAHTLDSHGHGTRSNESAAGALCADESARAGTFLPDSGGHRVREGISFVLDALDIDWSVARD